MTPVRMDNPIDVRFKNNWTEGRVTIRILVTAFSASTARAWTMQVFIPGTASGQIVADVDPDTLFAGRDSLENSRLIVQRELIERGIRRFTIIEVNRDGVVLNGNHGVRAAAEAGTAVSVLVRDLPLPSFGKLLDLPVITR